MSDNYKIYVDASRPATLNDGAGALTDCATLQEACSQWHWLHGPPMFSDLVGSTALSRLTEAHELLSG